jgi:hypothetical protein
MEENKDEITQVVRNWLEKLIIGMNVCPFAKDPYEKNAVRIIVSQEHSLQSCLTFFEREIRYLAKHQKTETTLIVFPELSDIAVFNTFYQKCEEMVAAKKWYKEYQLTFFHPFANIQEFPAGSAHHLVIQAPYPVLHLLRVASVERLGAKVKNDVHVMNDQKLSELSDKDVQKLWEDIKNPKKEK